MTINVTWCNVYKLAFLVIIALTLVLTAGSVMVQWQIDQIDWRLDERLSIYHREQNELQRRIELLEENIVR